MSKIRLKIAASDFKKIKAKVRSLEKESGLLDKKNSLSKLLMASFFPIETDESVEIKVKRIILFVTGDNDSDPSSLHGSLELVKNLKFGDDEFVILRFQLNDLLDVLKKVKATASEVKKCTKVSDVVSLVNNKAAVV